ncbi:MAG: hypothetical protein Q8K48_02075 [Candidatus Planktophila sp.]|nr:hypothetical protein [Candidatus Planktophila sp.]
MSDAIAISSESQMLQQLIEPKALTFDLPLAKIGEARTVISRAS